MDHRGHIERGSRSDDDTDGAGNTVSGCLTDVAFWLAEGVSTGCSALIGFVGSRGGFWTVKEAVERRLQRLLQQNPLRTGFQRHYEEIVAEYNREKDRVTIEQTFEALLKLVQELNEEETRAVREGLDEESLAIFGLLKKQDLAASSIKGVKTVAVGLVEELKAAKLRVDQWREKEASRDAARVSIRDFLWSDATGLPVDLYTEHEVDQKSEDVFHHVFRAYPTVPSPYYESAAA